MLINATLLRVDPPPPAPSGPALSLRCSLDALTANQQERSTAMGWGAGNVMYLPAGQLPAGVSLVVNGRALAQVDGGAAAVLYRVVYVNDRVGPMSHLEVFLAPV